MTDTHTLGDALPREMARVRDEVMPAYLAIGAPGFFALSRSSCKVEREKP